MKVIFAGTPEFARVALDALVQAGFAVPLVLTQPDRPAGRGMKLQASPVKQYAQERGIARAIEAGDAETGVTIMQMDAGLDTGDMLLSERVVIQSADTTAVLHDRLAALGGRLIVQALRQLEGSGLSREPQPQAGVTYAHKIDKAESNVDWSLPATVIGRRIRAFDPFPGASTALGAETIKLWGCATASMPSAPGSRPGQILSVDAEGIVVACGEDALRLTLLQRAGGKRLAAADFVRGFDVQAGMVLGVPEGGAGA